MLELGKLHAMQSICGEDGFFTVVAIDHPVKFVLEGTGQSAPVAGQNLTEVATAKRLSLLKKLGPAASAVLLEPDYGLPAALSQAVLPPGKGLITCLESADHQEHGILLKQGDLREGWSVAKAKAVGASGVKFLWRYRAGTPEGEQSIEMIKAVAAECAANSILLILEPIWMPLGDESLDDPQTRAQRASEIVDFCLLAQELGADIVKTEFPGSVGTEAEAQIGAENCAILQEKLQVPWLLLSAGLPYDVFKVQMEIAAKAGCSGFIAGRSIWATDGENGEDLALSRFYELYKITKQYGKGWQRSQVWDAQLSTNNQAAWYTNWH